MLRRSDVARDDAKLRLGADNDFVEMSEREIMAEMPGVEMEIGGDEGANVTRGRSRVGQRGRDLSRRGEGASAALQDESDAESEDGSRHIDEDVVDGGNAVSEKALNDFRADGKEEGAAEGEEQRRGLEDSGGGEPLKVEFPEEEGKNGKFHDMHGFAGAHGKIESLLRGKAGIEPEKERPCKSVRVLERSPIHGEENHDSHPKDGQTPTSSHQRKTFQPFGHQGIYVTSQPFAQEEKQGGKCANRCLFSQV